MEFKIERSVNIHIEDKHEVKMEKCEFCDKMLKAGSQMFRHKRRFHCEKTLQCNECGKKFRYQQEFKKHQLGHSGVKYALPHT